MNPEVLVPNKVLGNYREYELYTRDYKYSNAVYKEVWHECGTEAAVERALIKQKNEFNSYFKKFYNQIFGVDSDLKSESISEHIWGNLDCFCQWCAAMRNDKNCHTKDGSMPF
jgi:hypothetical protein